MIVLKRIASKGVLQHSWKVNSMLRMKSTGGLTLCSDDEFGIRTITLNNPQKRNTLSYDMLSSIENDLARENGNLKVVVIKSSGSVFSSGHDLKELSKDTAEEYHAKVFNLCTKVMMSLQDLSVPVIAQVEGLASAAGCQLVSSCDISVASKSSSFATPGINSGLFCTTPGVALARSVPRKAALHMLFTGFSVTAEEALQYGLVSKVVDDVSIEQEVRKIAEKIASLSGPVVRLGKKAFYKQVVLNLPDAYKAASQIMVDNLKFDDAKEGIDAFIHKRLPVWKHQN